MITQYADDSTLFLQNEEELDAALIIIDNFFKASGLKFNTEKNECI